MKRHCIILGNILSGVIIELHRKWGILKCDNSAYGNVYIGPKSDYYLRDCLLDNFKVNDRVMFKVNVNKNRMYEDDCGYIAYHMKKVKNVRKLICF